tara:strand:- start:88 stop:300 length:213 start_codon:yes stop_codon:yes gene_type:complete
MENPELQNRDVCAVCGDPKDCIAPAGCDAIKRFHEAREAKAKVVLESDVELDDLFNSYVNSVEGNRSNVN